MYPFLGEFLLCPALTKLFLQKQHKLNCDLKSEQEASEYQNEGEKRKKRKTRELVGSTEN